MSTLKLKTIPVHTCYNCGSNRRTLYAVENGFSLVKCVECGLLYTSERPDDETISNAHQRGKYPGIRDLDLGGRFDADKIPVYTTVLDDVFKGKGIAVQNWLDLGCGHGEFLVALDEYFQGGIDLVGIEPNIHKRASALKRGLVVGENIEAIGEQFDAISLLNVYSHLPDPPKYIDLVGKRLRPGGVLLIQTGDTADYTAKDHYRPFYLPDHLSFASEKIITDILCRLDFEIVNVSKYPFFRRSIKQIGKELVKAMLPRYRHRSRIKYLFRWRRYAHTDMYVLAKRMR
jgi:SAM-dependent methyltransferase